MTATRWKALQPWIVVAFVGLLAIGGLTARVGGRHLRAMRAAVGEDSGPIPMELLRLIGAPLPWTIMMALNGTALGIVWVMTMKPAWLGAVGVVVVATALGAVVGSTMVRRAQRVTPIDAHPTESADLPDRSKGGGGPMTMTRTIRLLLLFEVACFIAAALVHFGVLVRGYEHQKAGVAESVIGLVLLTGLTLAWINRRWTRRVGIGAQAFALVGTLVGMFTIAIGVGPRTGPDIAYHVAIAAALVWGLVVAKRAPAGQAGQRT